jgi:hypothetical protein
MAATSRPRSDRDALPATLGLPSSNGTGRCHPLGGCSCPHTLRPKPPETPGTPRRTWYPPSCRSACRSGRRHLRRSLAFGFSRGPALPAAGQPESTSASRPGEGGSPSRPGRSRLRCYHPQTPSFHAFQLATAFVVGRLVPLAFHRVFGTLEGKYLLVQNSPQAVGCQTNACLTFPVGNQPGGRPHAEAEAQRLRRRLHGLAERGRICGGHQDSRSVAKHLGVRGGKPQRVQRLPLGVRQLPIRRIPLLAIRLYLLQEVYPSLIKT